MFTWRSQSTLKPLSSVSSESQFQSFWRGVVWSTVSWNATVARWDEDGISKWFRGLFSRQYIATLSMSRCPSLAAGWVQNCFLGKGLCFFTLFYLDLLTLSTKPKNGAQQLNFVDSDLGLLVVVSTPFQLSSRKDNNVVVLSEIVSTIEMIKKGKTSAEFCCLHWCM